jgi:outer membrane protein assembly factor BamB
MNGLAWRNSIGARLLSAALVVFVCCTERCAAAPGDVLLTISNPDGIVSSAFGDALSVASGTILVGARNTSVDNMPFVGRAYAFDSSNGELRHTLHDPDPIERHQFGKSTAIVGDYLLVGADNPPRGTYVYDRATGSHINTLLSPKPQNGDSFASALTAAGDKVLVSAPSQDFEGARNAGEVFLMNPATGEVLLCVPNPSPFVNDLFGASDGSAMGVAGGKIFVGEFLDRDSEGNVLGSVAIFDEASGELIEKIYNPKAENLNDLSEWFGETLVVNERILVVGARHDSPEEINDAGAVYVFDTSTGDELHYLPNPYPSELEDFGSAVALIGDDILVAARGDNPDGVVQSGAAFLFDGWTGELLLSVPNPSGNPFEFFGWSIAALGNDFVIGAPYAEGGGRVYVIEGVAPRIEGDANRDGIVNIHDLNAVRNDFGLQKHGLGADANRNGIIDIADLNAVRNHFGESVSLLHVPEPASWGIALTGVTVAAALCIRQPRNKLDAGFGDDQTEWRVVEVRVN